MMAFDRDRVDEAACRWVIRLRDASADDWAAFTAWLEADPAHNAAYELAALADADAGALPRRKPAALAAPARPGFGRRAMLGWGIAAVLVGIVGYRTLTPPGPTYEVATAPGERRTIALDDGSRIDLNGDSRIILSRDNVRFARLESGEALFTVTHDAARPFRVEAGGDVLQDLGTVFNVLRGRGGTLDVAVAEGAVRYNPGPSPVDLRPGMTLRKRPGRPPELGRRSAESITGWREGRLSYVNATVGEIGADLARNVGLPVTVSPAVAGRRFSGVIRLDPDPDLLFARVGALLEVEARRQGSGWLLTEGRNAP